MSEIGISIRLSQINVPSDKKGRVNVEDVEPGRTAQILDGKSNIGEGYILILDADGDPDKISKEDNDQTDNVAWEVKFIGGVHERERNATFVLGRIGDDKVDSHGDKVPFEFVREGRDAKVHFNKAHPRYTGGLRGEVYFRQWRRVKNGTLYFSEWLGASDGRGLRCGSQA